MADFSDLEKTFDCATEVVAETKNVGIQKPSPDRDKTEVRKDYEYTR